MRAEPMRCRLTTVLRIESELGLERIDLLKIDVEGSEAEILRGIEDADWSRIAQIAAEIHDDANAETIASMLGERGFRTSWIQDDALAGSPLRMVCARRRRRRGVRAG